MIFKAIAFTVLMAISVHASGEVDSNNTSLLSDVAFNSNNKIVNKVLLSLNGIVEDVSDFLKINNISTTDRTTDREH